MAGFAEQAQVSPKYYKPFDERGEVADKATRNAIARKYARMRVVTLDDQSGWRLKTCPAGQTLAAWGTDDSQWEAADSSALTPGSVDNSLLATDVKVGSLAALRAAWGTVAKAYASVQDFLDNLLSRTATLETKTSTLSGTNTGDQDISGIAANATALNAHKADLANPHAVTATQVGLGNVSNDAQVKRSELGVASGVATLDAGGKVPTTQLPDAVLGALKFKGTYNFAANRISSPDSALNNAALPLASASNLGFYFIVLDSGVLNSKIYNTGDWLLSNGTAGWTCIDNTDAVSMVAGRIGNVVLTTADVAEDVSRMYFTEARTLASLLTGLPASTGTLAPPTATDKILAAWGKVVSLFGAIGQPSGLATLGADGLLTNSQRANAFSPTVEIFSTAGTFTWTKPAGAKIIRVVCLGGGGGGGSGGLSQFGVAATGGAGGGGGGRSVLDMAAALLGATVSVTVGAGGIGGAAIATSANTPTNGNVGTTGASSLFGAFVLGRGGGGGGGGTATASSPAGGGGGGGTQNGGNGGNGQGNQSNAPAGLPLTVPETASGGGGGGGGGGHDGANNGGFGGSGGYNSATAALGLAGQMGGNPAGTVAGGNAVNIDARLGIAANGGAGGAKGGAGNGGNGGFPTGGGGGGGTTVYGYGPGATGQGGNGGGGVVIIYCY